MFGEGFWGKGGLIWKEHEWLQASEKDGSGRSEHGGSLEEPRAAKCHRKQHKEASMGKLSCEEPCV